VDPEGLKTLPSLFGGGIGLFSFSYKVFSKLFAELDRLEKINFCAKLAVDMDFTIDQIENSCREDKSILAQALLNKKRKIIAECMAMANKP
jgi:hypothetical protein